ncbi:MAG: flap endonuclease [Armatimonadia bacterium]|nr:flap endonuclease [Armatimonadia bacterium]
MRAVRLDRARRKNGMAEHRILLVDGTAVAYRAYYAIRDLSTAAGRPTNAVFGFVRMLRQMQRAWEPTHWCVAFDGGLPEERTRRLESYKAQREEMPDALSDQLADIDRFLDAARVPWLMEQGQEADDLLASLCAEARAEAMEVLIATHDKDLFQLVGEGVSIVPPTRAGERMGPKEIEARTGVAPAQVVDWLAMVGDVSDNIPGVPGIGKKTAARLLREYGSLESLWERIEEVRPERIRRALEDCRRDVERNRKLLRLREDLMPAVDWDAYVVRPGDAGKLAPLFEELEFEGLAREARQAELF